MKRYLLLIILAAFINGCKSQSAKTITQTIDTTLLIVPGKNISIPSDVPGLAIVEPHLSIHPGNDNHLLVAAMIITNKDNPYESARLVSFSSGDGGATWKQVNHDYWGYDPWTAILPGGKTFMTWLGHPRKFRNQMIIQVFQSGDGGINWIPGTQTIDGEYDGTKMAIDHKAYTIVFVSKKFSNEMNADLYFTKSIHGEKFSEHTVIDCNGKMESFTQPVILSNGTIVVATLGPNNSVTAHSSVDGGATFATPYSITKLPGHSFGYSQLTADSSQSGTKDRLYFVWAHGGIWLNSSVDNGKTWTKNIRADLFLNNPKSYAMVPSAAVNKNGVLGISWVDKQSDDDKTAIYFAASADGGKTFSRPVRISDKSTDARTKANADVANKFPGGGHYSAIATKSDGSFQLVWSDSRTGVFQLQTCNISISNTGKAQSHLKYSPGTSDIFPFSSICSAKSSEFIQ